MILNSAIDQTVKSLGMAATAVILFAGSASSAEYLIRAYDSNGNDTGNCMEQVTGGYALKTCDGTNTSQSFEFDPNSSSSTMKIGTVCVTVPSTTANPADHANWNNGQWIARRTCGSNNYSTENWAFDGTDKIEAPDAPSTLSDDKCLSADGVNYTPPRIILMDCSNTSQLTQWDVVAN